MFQQMMHLMNSCFANLALWFLICFVFGARMPVDTSEATIQGYFHNNHVGQLLRCFDVLNPVTPSETVERSVGLALALGMHRQFLQAEQRATAAAASQKCRQWVRWPGEAVAAAPCKQRS